MSEEVVSFIKEQLTTTPQTFNQICRKHGYSKDHVNKLFKERYGLTALQWRESNCTSNPALDAEKKVLAKVARALIEGYETVEALAKRFNFTDGHTLMLKFKAQYGVPPTTYRKQHKP